MATGKRISPKTMGLFTLFAADVCAWKSIGFLGSGANLDAPPVTFSEALKFWWHYPAVRATLIYRVSHWCYRNHIRLVPGMLWRMNIRRFGLDILPSVSIGPGLFIPHPVGTVVVARGLGRNVRLNPNITIGPRTTFESPLIGSDVTIGAGARILGGIVIGDGATIGANAVVIDDVPPGATVVGIPGKPIKFREAHAPKQTMEIFHSS